jgi:hypothetical protein
VEITIDPTVLVRDGKVVEPWVRGTYGNMRGPQAGRPDGVRWLCKLGVWTGAPWDVRSHSARHATFPRTARLQQLYDDEEFEACRALGAAAAAQTLAVRTDAAACDRDAGDDAA